MEKLDDGGVQFLQFWKGVSAKQVSVLVSTDGGLLSVCSGAALSPYSDLGSGVTTR